MLKEMKCNCGLPVRYSHGAKGDSCNKYTVCPTYDQLLEENQKLQKQLYWYRYSVNQIDDYFEYRNESLKDRKKVHQLLGNLTDKLV
ncbi:hypothetical protein [Pseudoalteromonas phage J2-1]|uniref:Uncharacterized protein n=1 Tax=Pseudoalteromonas phage J2-1 TaxID=2023998 RepID=A0A223LH86_9CAUD|nr:hypothetical protein HOR90_gp43 [Pseudoalteromonas phage J2-1]ASU03330.1 hypothetical protein [Pseudoalteromonas phage J2-1]